MRRRPSLAALAVALALALGVIGADPGPTSAWSSGACPGATGVTVIVDFTAVGGDVEMRCAPALPRTGLDALAAAGFAVTPVTIQPAFVCRIDGLPGPGDESCSTTPAATAYWSYWTAPRGGTWRYSPVGAAASRPVAGTVEGWSFVTGNTPKAPSVAPPPIAPATPVPTPQATPQPTATPAVRATVVPTARPSMQPTGTPTTTTVPPETATSLASPSDSASTRPTASESASSSPVTVEPAAAAPPTSSPAEPSGAGPMGTLLGIAAVAAVGGAAVVARRRSAAAGG